MGLLDDAIREHLELKRRRGADAQEVGQQEREALGPIHGAAQQVPGPQAPSEPHPVPEAAPESPDAEGVPMTAPAHQPPEPEAIPEPPVVEADLPQRRPEPEPEPEPEIDWREPRRAEKPASEGDEDEDVLEETPEFLQETPEHDRLWFEQRPPRDFDF
jgi:hypothetical protein